MLIFGVRGVSGFFKFSGVFGLFLFYAGCCILLSDGGNMIRCRDFIVGLGFNLRSF